MSTAEHARLINIKPIKNFAKKEMREDSIFRKVLLEESDEMTFPAYIAKVETWFKILNAEKKQ